MLVFKHITLNYRNMFLVLLFNIDSTVANVYFSYSHWTFTYLLYYLNYSLNIANNAFKVILYIYQHCIDLQCMNSKKKHLNYDLL